MNREEQETGGRMFLPLLWLGLVAPRRRWVQRLLGCMLCTSILAAGGIWWLQRYIASRKVADQVAARLEKVLGVPVWVGQVHFGLHGATLSDVELFEPGASLSGQPWAVIQRADVDLSGWDVVQGRDMPRQITLSGATVNFSLDAAGHALTQVPLPKNVITKLPRRQPEEQPNEPTPPPPTISIPDIPNLHVRDGCLVLRQNGQPDMVVDHIDFDVANQGNDLVLGGQIAGHPWGAWQVEGRMNHESQAGTVSLDTIRPIHLSQRLVDKIRFVSPAVWQQVQVEGDLPARLAFQFDLTHQTLHYDAVLQPHDVRVHLPLVQLTVDQVGGKITARDDHVQIEKLSGQSAGGRIDASGKVWVSLHQVDVGVKVRVQDVDVVRLPKYWQLPKGLTGHLKGEADLSTVFENGGATFKGQGHGTIADGHLAAIPTGPIYLKLFADNNGFHFAEPQLALKFWP